MTTTNLNNIINLVKKNKINNTFFFCGISKKYLFTDQIFIHFFLKIVLVVTQVLLQYRYISKKNNFFRCNKIIRIFISRKA